MADAPELSELISDWDGKAVVVRHDRPSGAWIFVALHDWTLGPPTGGTRVKVYSRKEDGLLDALRLAAGMTHKFATIGMPYGGGKAVIALREEIAGAEREALLTRYAELVNGLRGAFLTGQDLGATIADMVFLARASEFVMGTDPRTGVMGDPGPYTALGVLVGMRAACAACFGTADLAGRTVLIQGVGDVGAPLARAVAAGGGRVLISDLDAERARTLAAELDGRCVAPEEVYATECDVYAPCAVGATLNATTIPTLRCRVVAGSANNQLAAEEDARRLFERGILYAPDYVVNAGGAIAFSLFAEGVTDEAAIRARVEELHGVTAALLREAKERDESPLRSAQRRVARALA